MPANLGVTTVSAPIAVGDDRINLSTAAAVGDVVFVNREAMKVKAVQGTTHTVLRGQNGTRALAHASGQPAFYGVPAYFSPSVPQGKAVAAQEVAVPRIVLPEGRVFRILNDSWIEVPPGRLANHRAVDPDTGYEYVLVDCAAAFQVGEWVAIDGDGLATQLSASSKGRIGIIIEAASASDTLTWAIVVGVFAAALFTSGVTTACVLMAGTGCANISTSTGGNVIFNATCTVAPSTATSPSVGDGVGTALLNNPFCYGLTTDIVP